MRPPALRPGDRVAVVSPSGPVTDHEALRAGVEVLRSWGLVPELGSSALEVTGHLAGDDLTRAADLNAALRDPGIRAVFASRGGYGGSRTADLVDWEVWRADPVWLVGFSDVTALHAAAWVRAGLVTVHGPHVGRLARHDQGSRDHLRGLLTGQVGAGATVPVGGEALVPGHARGRLLGGNLAILCSLLGTVDELDTREAILLLEDVGEPPYRLDRMLMQLLRAGLLDEVEGVLVGSLVHGDPPADRPSATADEVLDEILGSLGVPVLTGATVGHRDDQLALPLGVEVDLDADAGTVTLREDVTG